MSKFKITRQLNVCILMSIIVLLILVFWLPFVAGKYGHNNTEKIALETSKIVKTDTRNSKYLTVTVASTDESGSIADHEREFYNLYGTFRQEQASFGSAINFSCGHKQGKEHTIYLKDYDSISISSNLSLFYLGPAGSVQYNGHYKHKIYPFELMFEDPKRYGLNVFVAYISQSHADRLLDSLDESRDSDGKYSPEQYRTLIDKRVNMSVDDTLFEYVIHNIYYETNYYYSAMNEVLSDFILTSYRAPNNLMEERRNIYFMNQYPYQNQYYMDYINKTYSSKTFDVSINKNNVIKDFDDQKILDFYYSPSESPNNGIFITLIIIYYFLLALCLVLLIIFGFSFSLLPSLSLGVCVFIPYLVFWIIFKITKSSSCFTKIAGINYFIGIVIMTITLIVWHFINRYVLGKRKKL